MPPCISYKIGDFGQCSVLRAEDVSEGDSRYLAQEVLNGDTSNLPAADIFSLALSVVELAAGIHLPSGGDEYHELRDGLLPWAQLTHLSQPLQSLLGAMAAPNAAHRPTALQILEHPVLIPHLLRRGGVDSFTSIHRTVAGDQPRGFSSVPFSESSTLSLRHNPSVPAVAPSLSLKSINALLAVIDEAIRVEPGATRVFDNGPGASLCLGPTPVHSRFTGGVIEAPGSVSSRDCSMGDGQPFLPALITPGNDGRSVSTETTPLSTTFRTGDIVGCALGESGISLAAMNNSESLKAAEPPAVMLSASAAFSIQRDIRALLAAAGIKGSELNLTPGLCPTGRTVDSTSKGPMTAGRTSLSVNGVSSYFSPEI